MEAEWKWQARVAFWEQPCSVRCLRCFAASLLHTQQISLLLVSEGVPVGTRESRVAAVHTDTGRIFISVLSS